MDRKTARRYAAEAAGLARDPGGVVNDELIGAVVAAVRPDRPGGHGHGWDALTARQDEIKAWVKQGLTATKVAVLLARSGTDVPYRTVHRFAADECGFRSRGATVPVVDGEPGVECQIDFAELGRLPDAAGVRRKVHALIFTACYSRHLFVHLTFGQTRGDVVAGCGAAWALVGGVFIVVVPDNMKPIVAAADAVNPRFTAGWLDYSQHAGFVTDPARVRTPTDKPKVERAVQYVGNNFFAGETFTGLADAQQAATRWCATTAGTRVHGSTQARPAEVFTGRERPVLLPVPAAYDPPILRDAKVHRDFHIEVGKALYSLPGDLIGSTVSVRADSMQVKVSHHGAPVKIHPRQAPGGRSTDVADLHQERSGYAMRDLDRLVTQAAGHGENVGIYVRRLLDEPLPWTRMRAVYRLLGLCRRYGDDSVDTACGTALMLEVIAVGKIDAMLAKALEATTPAIPKVAATAGRFARDPAEFRRPGAAGSPAARTASVATAVAE